MENESRKHVQLPNNMTKDGLTPQDLLVYISIKRYAVNNIASPSLPVIMKHCGASVNTVRNCINHLEEKEYLTVEKAGRNNRYIFSDYKKFEPFSDNFLDNENLTFTEKSYILASQQHMFKDIEDFGKITYTNKELATIINMSESTISRCNHSLEKKEYLTTIKTTNKDSDGNIVYEKIFHLNELGQRVIWALCKHDEEIKENTKNINTLQTKVESQDQLIHQLMEEIRELKQDKKPKGNLVVD